MTRNFAVSRVTVNWFSFDRKHFVKMENSARNNFKLRFSSYRQVHAFGNAEVAVVDEERLTENVIWENCNFDLFARLSSVQLQPMCANAFLQSKSVIVDLTQKLRKMISACTNSRMKWIFCCRSNEFELNEHSVVYDAKMFSNKFRWLFLIISNAIKSKIRNLVIIKKTMLLQ